jgi:GNAT superfamily N-acetyltransferase
VSANYRKASLQDEEELFVLDEYRGMKIGKKLMGIIEGKANERGSKLVALATIRAGDFYNAIGYDESATYFKKSLSNEKPLN